MAFCSNVRLILYQIAQILTIFIKIPGRACLRTVLCVKGPCLFTFFFQENSFFLVWPLPTWRKNRCYHINQVMRLFSMLPLNLCRFPINTRSFCFDKYPERLNPKRTYVVSTVPAKKAAKTEEKCRGLVINNTFDLRSCRFWLLYCWFIMKLRFQIHKGFLSSSSSRSPCT